MYVYGYKSFTRTTRPGRKRVARKFRWFFDRSHRFIVAGGNTIRPRISIDGSARGRGIRTSETAKNSSATTEAPASARSERGKRERSAATWWRTRWARARAGARAAARPRRAPGASWYRTSRWARSRTGAGTPMPRPRTPAPPRRRRPPSHSTGWRRRPRAAAHTHTSS